MDVPPGNRPAVRGIGPEAYLNGTSQGPTPEDAEKDGMKAVYCILRYGLFP